MMTANSADRRQFEVNVTPRYHTSFIPNGLLRSVTARLIDAVSPEEAVTKYVNEHLHVYDARNGGLVVVAPEDCWPYNTQIFYVKDLGLQVDQVAG